MSFAGHTPLHTVPMPWSVRLAAVAVGLAVAGLMAAVHPSVATEADPDGPSCVGCHHGADPVPPTSLP